MTKEEGFIFARIYIDRQYISLTNVNFVGVDLRTPIFIHGILYVVFLRLKIKSSLKLILPQGNLFYILIIV